MIGSIPLDKRGNPSVPKSAYQPSEDVRALTFFMRQSYEDGQAVQDEPRKEYNGMSITERANESQRRWLADPDPEYVGEEDWRFNGIRPITRNRIIFTAARLTAQLLYPKNFAQNDQQEEDRDAAYVMDTLVEYNIRRSNYETAFLFGVIGALVNPVSYMDVSYCEAFSEAWVRGERQKVLDEMLSGFQYTLIPTDEILFPNMYQYEYQLQDWIIHKKRAPYEEMESRFSEHENWNHVQEGKVCIPHEDGYFYDVEDTYNDHRVGYVCFKHRRKDIELYFVNNVYLSNPNTEYNPFTHRRINENGQDVPLYNQTKFGYEPIDEMRFYGYKSLAHKMENDQMAADREWQDYYDATRLATFQPIVTMGAGKLDKSVVTPAGITEIGKGAKMIPVQVSNPAPAKMAFQDAERAADESSIDPQSSGIKQGPQQTKAETLLLERNTETGLGIPAKMIGRMVKEAGGLMNDDIIRYQTIGKAGEILGEMTYRTFIVDGRVRDGKNTTTYVKFSDKYAGRTFSKEEKEMEEYGMLTEFGDDKEVHIVNPAVFSRMRFLTTVDPDQLMRRNDAFERVFKLSVYDRAMANALVQKDMDAQAKITRDFLFEPLVKGDAAKYMPNVQKIAQQVIPGGVPNLSTESPRYPHKDIPGRMETAAVESGML